MRESPFAKQLQEPLLTTMVVKACRSKGYTHRIRGLANGQSLIEDEVQDLALSNGQRW
jgi:hypothetical protein